MGIHIHIQKRHLVYMVVMLSAFGVFMFALANDFDGSMPWHGADEISVQMDDGSRESVQKLLTEGGLQIGPQIGVDNPLVSFNAEDFAGSAVRIKGSLDNPAAAPFVVFRGSSTGGDPSFKVDGSGNVGVGVVDPASKFQVGPQIGVDSPLVTFNAEDFAGSAVRIKGSSVTPGAAPLVVFGGSSTGGDPSFKVDGSGNVGVGVVDPLSTLDVSGDIRASGNVIASEPISNNHVATKGYVDEKVDFMNYIATSNTGRTGGWGGKVFETKCLPQHLISSLSVRTGSSVDALRIKCTLLTNTDSSYFESHVGSWGGSRSNLDCPSGFYIYGIYGRSGDEIDAIGVRCRDLEGTETWDSPVRGGSGGSSFSLDCPSNQFVVGITGGAYDLVDWIQLTCAQLQ